MLLVPYSSTIETMLWRMPVRIEATTTAVMIPITIPRTVSADLNLCDDMLSNAIFRTSKGREAEIRNRLGIFVLALLRQRNDRVEPRGLPRGIKSGNNADDARNRDRENHIKKSDRHRDAKSHSYELRSSGS